MKFISFIKSDIFINLAPVDECTINGDCGAAKPVCNTGVSPKVCVGKLFDIDMQESTFFDLLF